MVIWAEDDSGAEILLGEPTEFVFKSESSAPADSLKLVFPCSSEWPRLVRLEVVEAKEKIFIGIVDEEISESDSRGMRVTLVARSPAALLLDNEAEPQTIINPSLGLMEARFLRPLGFTEINGDRSIRAGKLDVNKGTSVYGILEKFAENFLGSNLRVSSLGTVSIGERKVKEWKPKGLISRKKLVDNYSVISKLHLWDSVTGNYSSVFTNPNFTAIPRERCLRSGEPKKIFSDGISHEFSFAGRIWANPGDLIVVENERFEVDYVSLSSSSSGDKTVIKARAVE